VQRKNGSEQHSGGAGLGESSGGLEGPFVRRAAFETAIPATIAASPLPSVPITEGPTIAQRCVCALRLESQSADHRLPRFLFWGLPRPLGLHRMGCLHRIRQQDTKIHLDWLGG
jgi:hypothetical protein